MTHQQHLNILNALNVLLHTVAPATNTRVLIGLLEADRRDVIAASAALDENNDRRFERKLIARAIIDAIHSDGPVSQESGAYFNAADLVIGWLTDPSTVPTS